MDLTENFNPIKFIEKNYIVDNESNIKTIFFGKNYEFKYIDLKNSTIILNHDESSYYSKKNIFKFNLLIIIDYLKNYFEQIDIKIFFDHPSRNEQLIKKEGEGFKHNIYIQINKFEKYFDCGIDLIERNTFLSDEYDSGYYKYISSIVNLDYYKYFQEDTDNYDDFIKDIIYRLLIILCSINKDEFTLAIILFSCSEFKSNLESSNIKRDCEIFRKVIYAKRDNKINLKDWFEEIIPLDPDDGKELEWDNFVKYIKTIVYKFNFIDENYNISYDTFEKIILKINSELSIKIDYYKMIYQKTVNLVIESLKLIMDLIESSNKTKKYIPQYINYLLSDIVKYHDNEILEKIFDELDIYLSEN